MDALLSFPVVDLCAGDHTVCLAVFVDSRCIMMSKQGSGLFQQLLSQMPSDGQLVRKEVFALPQLAFLR